MNELAALQPELTPHASLWVDHVLSELAEDTMGDAARVAARARDLGIAEIEVLSRFLVARRASLPAVARDQLLIAHRVAATHGYLALRQEAESMLLARDFAPLVDQDAPQTLGDPSSVIPAQYVIRARLGGGGFGDVLHAYDIRRHQDVAIKVLHRPTSLSAKELEFRMDSARIEFEATRRLHHRGIARVFALGCNLGGQPYVVQEYIHGKSLRDLMPWRDSQTAALALLARVAYTMDALHSANVLHLDLKPDNVIVRPDGTPTLIDFGIAALMTPDGDAATVSRGTSGYASPEQRAGTSLDERADIYAFGILAHELLVGALPLPAKPARLDALLEQIGWSSAGTSFEVHELLTGEIAALLNAAIDPKRDRRPKSAREMAIVLNRLAENP